MIDGPAVMLWIMVIGTAINANRILRRWHILTTADPIELCDGCRDERRRVMLSADAWAVMGPAGAALHVLIEATTWWLMPFEPALRKAAGKEPVRKCPGAECAAGRSAR